MSINFSMSFIANHSESMRVNMIVSVNMSSCISSIFRNW